MTTVTTPSELATALKAAKGGEVILASGRFARARPGKLPIYTSSVTIKAADPKNPPVFAGGMTLDAWENVIFDSAIFDIGSATAQSDQAARAYGGKNLVFHNCLFTGRSQPDGSFWGFGIMVDSVQGLTISGCTITKLWKGLSFGNSDNVSVVDNDFPIVGSDGINVRSSRTVLIARNYFGKFHPAVGDHSDAVQFLQGTYGGANDRPQADITVIDNLVDADPSGKDGGLGRPQGTLFGTEVLNHYLGVTRVERNLYVNTLWNAVLGALIDHLELHDNVVLWQPAPAGSKGVQLPNQSWLKIQSGAGNASGNRAMSISLPPGVAGTLNTIISAATQSEIDLAVAAWRAKFRPKIPTPLEVAQSDIASLSAELTTALASLEAIKPALAGYLPDALALVSLYHAVIGEIEVFVAVH